MFRIQTKSSNGTLHFGRSEELYMRTYKNNENPFGLVEPLHSTPLSPSSNATKFQPMAITSRWDHNNLLKVLKLTQED